MAEPRKLTTENGVVCSMPLERFGYFGWPSVARLGDGSLVAGASGFRFGHVCPWGKTVLFTSHNEGRTWSAPRILNDTPLDDRDVGLLALGGSRLLVTWFTSDTRQYREHLKNSMPAKTLADVDAVLSHWTADTMERWFGSWVRFSEDGHAWSDFLRAPVTAPHGPITLSGDGILYLGKKWGPGGEEEPVAAFRSNDVGHTWDELGCVPLPEGCVLSNLTEPHVLQLPSGKLIGMIRYEYAGHPHERLTNFSLLQTVSDDCGQTWSAPQDIGVAGSPPHLLRHSSGTIICSYGYRRNPFGQRVIISHDDGKTWDGSFVLRDDGPDGDLGYPCSVELSDSRILTVYYQKPSSREDKCAILYSSWTLPE